MTITMHAGQDTWKNKCADIQAQAEALGVGSRPRASRCHQSKPRVNQEQAQGYDLHFLERVSATRTPVEASPEWLVETTPTTHPHERCVTKM